MIQIKGLFRTPQGSGQRQVQRDRRRFPGEPRFPRLKAIAMLEAMVERAGKTSGARRFFLPSLPLDAKLCPKAVRAHRSVENRLHWVLDVIVHDDLMRLRTEHGREKWLLACCRFH